MVSDANAAQSWVIRGLRKDDPLYDCPLCKQMMTEDELWEHWNATHYSDGFTHVCPICVKEHNNKDPQGNMSWGYSSHLHHNMAQY